jgi:hypothetical protein
MCHSMNSWMKHPEKQAYKVFRLLEGLHLEELYIVERF